MSRPQIFSRLFIWLMNMPCVVCAEEAVGNFTEETPPPTTITPLSATQRDKQDVAVEFDISQNGAGGAAVNRDPSLSQPDPSKSINPTSENLDKKAQKPKIELTNLDRTSRAPTDGVNVVQTCCGNCVKVALQHVCETRNFYFLKDEIINVV